MFRIHRPLRIGYWAGDIGPYAVHPSYTRAVMEAKEILEQQAGHELVEFPLPDATELAKHYSGYIYRYYRRRLELSKCTNCISRAPQL